MPTEKVPWDVAFDMYDPLAFTAPHVMTAPWADPDLAKESFKPKWNALDGAIDRRSHVGAYKASPRLSFFVRFRK